MQGPGANDQYSLHLVSGKSRILDRSQCGFRKHHRTIDHLVSLERYLRDAFAQKQQAVGLFFDLKRPMKKPGNMVSSETFTELASEADCMCSCRNISGTAESESELGPHSQMNTTQRIVFQLVASWLWHVLDWRLMSCPLVLQGTSSEHYLLTTCRSAPRLLLGHHRDIYSRQ